MTVDLLKTRVVRIWNSRDQIVGAGFLVTERHVLTCAHVVSEALSQLPQELPTREVKLDFPFIEMGNMVSAVVVFWQPEKLDGTGDIAGLELQEPYPADMRPVRLVAAFDTWEHPFRAFGFPIGYEHGVWASGVLRDRTVNGHIHIEDTKTTGYPVQSGFSGTPVWDDTLRGVVGMVATAERRAETKAAFIIPTDKLVAAWPDLRAWAMPPNPYRGLEAFRQEDADLFFGREAFVTELQTAVARKPFVAVIGASGSGKSSVVFAGLLPKVREETAVVHFRPDSRPFRALAYALLPVWRPDLLGNEWLEEARKLAKDLKSGNTQLLEVVNNILQRQPVWNRLLLVADQFEELFTVCPQPDVQRAFIRCLVTAVKSQTGQHRPTFTWLLTMRADFMGQATAERPLADALQDATHILGPMTREELALAVEKPAQASSVQFEPGLVVRVLDDVGNEPGNLPLLEFALTLLWDKQTNGLLTHADYEAIDEVKGALARYAEEQFASLREVEQAQARLIFTQLVQPGHGPEDDTRRRARLSEMGVENRELVKKLADTRLVVTNRLESGEETVEIVHEILTHRWQRLQEWMNEARRFREWQEQLRGLLRNWKEAGYDDGSLLRGSALTAAEDWLQNKDVHIPPAEQKFIEASIVAYQVQKERELAQAQELLEEAEARRQAEEKRADTQTKWVKRSLIGIGVLAFFLIVTIFSALSATQSQNEAENARGTAVAESTRAFENEGTAVANATLAYNNQRVAEARATEAYHAMITSEANEALALSREAEANTERERANNEALKFLAQSLAARSSAIRNTDPQLGLLLAIEAAYVHVERSETAIQPAIQAIFDGLGVLGGFGLSGHIGYVRDIAFSPNGRWFATMDTIEGQVFLWDLAHNKPSPEPIVLEDHEDAVTAMAFSADSNWLATAGGGNIVPSTSLIDIVLKSELSRLQDDTRGYDVAVRIWDLNTLEVTVLPMPFDYEDNGFVRYVAFVANGSSLVSIDTNGMILYWNLSNWPEVSEPVRLARLNTNPVHHVTSSDGRWLVVADQSGAVFRWDMAAEDPVATLDSYVEAGEHIQSLAFSPDNVWLATGERDGTIRLWNMNEPTLFASVIKRSVHDDPVTAVAFSSDFNWLASGGRDGQVFLWDLTVQPIGEEFVELSTQSHIVKGLGFSPDSEWLVIDYDVLDNVDLRGTIELWQIAGDDSLTTPKQVAAHENRITNILFSSDGKWLGSSSLDGSARLWTFAEFITVAHIDNLNNSHVRLPAHDEVITASAFDPENQWLVTGDNSGALRLWTRDDIDESFVGFVSVPYVELAEHEQGIWALTFSPDGSYLASASNDGAIRLTDFNSPDLSSTLLEAHNGLIDSIVFTHDSKRLISAGRDNVVRVWSIGLHDQEIDPVELLTDNTILSLAVDASGHWLAGGGFSSGLYLWDLGADDPNETALKLTGHELEIVKVAISPNGRWLASGSADTTIRLWDLDSGNVQSSAVVLRGHTDFIATLDFSPDGNWLASGSFDNTVQLWQVDDSGIVDEPIVLSGYQDAVYNLLFTPDSRYMITSDLGGTIQSWDLIDPDSIVESVSMSANTRAIVRLDISPDGQWLLTGGPDGIVAPGGFLYITRRGVPRLWPISHDELIELACITVGRNLSLSEFNRYLPDQRYRLSCPSYPAHYSVIATAREAALNQDKDQAEELFVLAAATNSSRIDDPYIETNRWIAQGLLNRARSLARELKIDEAVVLFEQALELDPALPFDDSLVEARRFAATEYAWQAFGFAAQGDVVKSLEFMQMALDYDPQLDRLYAGLHSSDAALSYTPRERFAIGYSLLCNEGIFAGHFDQVVQYCWGIFDLTSDTLNGHLYKGPGIAHTLLDNFEEAATALRIYIDWLALNVRDPSSSELLSNWNLWLDEVEAGRNPFTQDVLDYLRGEPNAGGTPSSWNIINVENADDFSIPLAFNMPVTGTIGFGDFKQFEWQTGTRHLYSEVYRIEADADDTLIIRVDAQFIGSELNAFIYLLDNSLALLGQNNDSFGLDPALTHTIEEAGQYFLVVAGLGIGEQTDAADNYFRVTVELLDMAVPFINVDNIAEYAVPLQIGQVYAGAITRDDYKQLQIGSENSITYRYGDFYQIYLELGDTVLIRTNAQSIGSALDTILFLYDSEYQFLVRNDDANGTDSAITFQAQEAGIYYIFVRDSKVNVFGEESEYFYEVVVEKLD
jgi:WD40 repeat protein/tetratricopeptide (TPR) repeat protein